MMKNKKPKTKGNFFSIKSKIALLCAIFILVAVVVNYLFLSNSTTSVVSENTENNLLDLSTAYSQNLSNALDKIGDNVTNIISSQNVDTYITSGGTQYATEAANFISMYLTMNTNAEEINLVDANGIILQSTNAANVGKDISSETYYTNMIESGQSTQSDAYTSSTSGDECVTFAVPVRGDMAGEAPPEDQTTTTDKTATDASTEFVPTTAGSVVIVEKVAEVSSTLTDISITSSESSYAYLLDSTGTIIYDPDEALIGTTTQVSALNDVVEQIQNGETPQADVINYTLDGKDYVASYSVNESNNWILVIAADNNEILSSLSDFTKMSIITSLIIIVILGALAYIFAGTIAKPIKKITELINKTADLDLKNDSSYEYLEKKQDETGEMSRAIAKMREVLHDLITQIGDASNNINETANNLNNITNLVNDHASDNSATAEELSASMEETAATTEVMNTNIEQIEYTTQDINRKALEGANLSNDLIERAAKLKDSTSSATQTTRRIFSEVKTKTDSAIEQSKAVEKINLLTKTINDIADQTSLLSLNASIEAARAGEAGRGFSVVAGEIGALAEQSANTVSNINEIVMEVHKAVESMTDSLTQTLEFLEKNVLVDYNEFAKVSDQYNNDAKTMNDTMKVIQTEVQSANEAMVAIAQSITEITAMVGEAADGISDVAQKNTNIVGLASNTYDMVKQNSDHAATLKDMIDKFTLS